MINFSSGLICLLGALAALGAAAIDMYLPSLPSIESELGGVSGSAQFTLSSYFIGLICSEIEGLSIVNAFCTVSQRPNSISDHSTLD